MSDRDVSEDRAIERPVPPRFFRWVVLVLISMAMFGNYYIYDCVSPLADVLKDQLGFSDTNIGWLNAIYSFPNIVMVLIGGIVIDRIGVKRATLLFAALCLVGAAVTASSGQLMFMATGRLIFGIGAESLIVAVTCAVARWFKGKELSFAFGVNLTIARLGSFMALNSPTWAKPAFQNWQWPLLIAVGAGVISVAAALVYWLLEDRATRRYTIGEAGATERVVFRELFQFGGSYWYVVLLCVTFYSAVFPFQTFATKYFMHAHGATREFGGWMNSQLTLFAMIFTPLFGLLVDRVARRALFMMFGSLLLVPVYLIMAYAEVSLYLPMAMLGIAFSLVPAVMWPSVAYLVAEARLGTAYGVMTMIQNIGLFAFNLILGLANDLAGADAANPGGYDAMLWILSTLGLAGFLFAWLLRRRETGPYARGLETIRTGSPG